MLNLWIHPPVNLISTADDLAAIAIAAVVWPLVFMVMLWWEAYKLNLSIAELVKIFRVEKVPTKTYSGLGCPICHHKHASTEPCFTGPEVRQ